MHLSEIAGKEIVNLVTGERLGIVGECDLIIDEATGKILALLIPKDRGIFDRGLFRKKDRDTLEVPWKDVKKVGNDMIIIEYEGIY